MFSSLPLKKLLSFFSFSLRELLAAETHRSARSEPSSLDLPQFRREHLQEKQVVDGTLQEGIVTKV